MIPTLIVLGLVVGRWWRIALVIGALGWPVALLTTNVMDLEPGLLGAAALGMVNTGLGTLIHQGALRLVRRFAGRGSGAKVDFVEQDDVHGV